MSDLGEKTEQPTSRRLSDARERGQVAKSMDLSAAIVLSGAFVLIFVFGPVIAENMASVTRRCLGPDGVASIAAGRGVRADLLSIITAAGRSILPVFLLMFIVAYISGLVQIGFLLTAKPLEPKLDRLNVIKGIGKLFSKRSLVKAMLDLGKFAIIGGVAYLVVHARISELSSLSGLSVGGALAIALRLLVELAIWCLAVLITLGVIDWSYQKWQRTEDLKMTKQEVQDERKSTDGDPQQKGRRMQLARTIAMQRISRDVPEADVVVTNPTHYAVALKYDGDSMNAPRVVAKGADYLALRIRQIAAGAGVAVVERPPLARALYAEVAVGQEVSAEHYEAVAEVLAYVYRLDQRAAS
ncbi:MAG: flagellar biosynthesis protein FlhB [Phycisphaerales bacterium]